MEFQEEEHQKCNRSDEKLCNMSETIANDPNNKAESSTESSYDKEEIKSLKSTDIMRQHEVFNEVKGTNQDSNDQQNVSSNTETSEEPKITATEPNSGDCLNDGTERIEIQSNILLKSAESAEAPNQQADGQKSNHSALSLLAEYASDDDRDNSSDTSVIEVPVPKSNLEYRDKVIEIDSDNDADSTTSSSSSSSSSSSDSEGGTYYLNSIRKKIEKIYDVDDEDEEEDDAECVAGAAPAGKSGPKNQKKQPVRAKGELLLEDLPPIEDLHISVPEEECVELGQIQSIVDKLVLVNALPNSTVVDLDTVLFLEKGKKVLGEVFDVLGQISEPLYCVRFNSKEQIDEKGISVGEKVYTAPKTQYTKFVVLGNLMKLHGSDASWEHDVEPPPQFVEYSDDEEERAARCRNRNKQRRNDAVSADTDNDEEAVKRARDDVLSMRSSSPDSIASSSITRRSPRQRGRGFRGNRGGMPSRGAFQQGMHPGFQRFDNGNPNSWHSNYTPHFMGQRGNPAPRWRLPQPPVYSNTMLPMLGQTHPPLLVPPPATLGCPPHTSHAYMRPPPPHYPVLFHPFIAPLPAPPAPPGEE